MPCPGGNPAIDPRSACGDIAGDLQDAGTNDQPPPSRPPGRRKFRRVLLLLLFLAAAALFWLNGPGLRWLAPRVGAHFLEKAGIRGTFVLEGSLTGGLAVRDLRLESAGPLASLSLARATPIYQFSEIIRGKLRGIEIDNLHTELRLRPETSEPEDKGPLDLEKLVSSLRAARGFVIPLSVDLRNVSLRATRDGKPVIRLASSDLRHAPGSSGFELMLGAITDATGREWPARKSRIRWSEDALAVDEIAPLPGIAVKDLLVRLPEGGGPSAEAELAVGDAIFVVGVSPGFSAVRLDLREGGLSSAELAEYFALEIPAAATLTSLSVNVDSLLPDPKAATGAVRLLLEDITSGDWTVPELSLDLELAEARAAMTATGQALGSGFSLEAEAPVSRTAGGFQPGELRGKFNVADVSTLIASLAERTRVIDPQAPAPQSMLDGDFTVTLEQFRPVLATAGLVVKPADPQAASSIFLKSRWQRDQPVSAEVEIEGMKASAAYHLESSIYQAGAEFRNFHSARIDRWLAIVKARLGGTLDLTASWDASGDVEKAAHRGKLTLVGLDFSRSEVPPIHAEGAVDYDWPAGFTANGLTIRSKDQKVSANAKLAGNLFELADLRWQAGESVIASGSAKLPVPADFAAWRDTLARDVRPVEVALETETLSLGLLKDWLPAASKLDSRSTGRLRIGVSGTYASPVVDAEFEARDLRSPEFSKLPPADLKLTLTAKDGRASVDGRATAPDFPAAVMTASLPFRPAGWADDPELIRKEPLSARLDLPRLDLSRFTSLVPGARKLTGILTGNIQAAGALGKPVVKGRLDLTAGGFEFTDGNQPAITGAAAALDATQDRITLANLQAMIAGGSLRGGGLLTLENGRPGIVDFRIAANHLPLLRNDSLIVRADADLRLAGPWERAALSGNVGIVDSLFYRDIELLPIGSPFTAPSAAALPKIDPPRNPAAAVPEPFRNWTVNLLVRTKNPFLIRGNVATGQVETNLRLGGTLANPVPDGTVEISDLKAALPFSTLAVRRGTLRFNAGTGFDPILEIRGNAEPRPYRVSVFVYGRASDPQLVLASSPPLPENEIMTLLATGTTTTGLEDPQAASSRAMQLLAEELRRGRFAVGKQLRPLLGLLDRVDFSLAEADPYSSESFSTATISITDRWFLSAGMGGEGDSRVLAIWRLTFH